MSAGKKRNRYIARAGASEWFRPSLQALGQGEIKDLKFWLSPTAFGNQTISSLTRALKKQALAHEETHGFAPLPRGRFALIVCNRYLTKSGAALSPRTPAADICIKHNLQMFVNNSFIYPPIARYC
jgi:hypothetical protein